MLSQELKLKLRHSGYDKSDYPVSRVLDWLATSKDWEVQYHKEQNKLFSYTISNKKRQDIGNSIYSTPMSAMEAGIKHIIREYL